MKRLTLLSSITLLLLSSSLFATERLVHQQILYQGSKTISSSNDQNPAWSRIASPTFQHVNSTLTANESQKWRLKVFYSVPEATGPFSIQARVNLGNDQRPIFSLGWDNAGRTGSREVTSNWLELKDSSTISLMDIDLYLARSSNNPKAKVEIHSIQLEIWQGDLNDRTQQANLGAPSVRPGIVKNPISNPKEAAKTAGIEFLKAAMSGDRKAMDEHLSITPVNMTTMIAVDRNSVANLVLPNGKTFADYLDSYDIEVIAYQDVAGLFDDWEKYEVRGWQISNKSFIFIGNTPKFGKQDFMAGKPLIFVMEEENGKMVVKGILS
ncbi:hypothetical protein [Entomospira culicis]|uniref:CBM-cenC domain-containing protein n=1 Tax=Entomospira culicis TaxID=2719989 RepID=A0A968GEH8_9SPIO|nr:hypothetical protein [Entomospira culicis]NIZ18854.1 hypothetical protein [Entomospira culicis]NIZ69069.1 hypothetical protein [Entomospira culicis]WDI37656.1 hypothetical protein PVA46_02415 [Entomospira culicis]WDI39284.1 hypothetical protein PVA47_02420 [Entomospira culicis]